MKNSRYVTFNVYLLVEKISNRISVLCERCRKENTLIQFTHFLQELIDIWTFQYVDLMHSTINFYWYNEISIWNRLKWESKGSEMLGEGEGWALTLKLLCTSVSSKSMTMHFLCMSECLIWGNRYRLCPLPPVSPVAWPIVCVWSPSTDPPFWLDFERLEEIDALRCLQQQNSDSHILRFGGFTFSSIFAANVITCLIWLISSLGGLIFNYNCI
jgi:hypothetical protein